MTKFKQIGITLADNVVKFIGSWTFIIVQTIIVTIWIIINIVSCINHYDPYPFILLNLIFSTEAAYATPLILMASSSLVSSGSTVRSLTMGNGIWTLNGTVGATASFTIWNLVATNLTFNAGASLINITDSSTNNITFAGGSTTYYGLQFNRGGSTASITLSGNNTFTNFIDIVEPCYALDKDILMNFSILRNK